MSFASIVSAVEALPVNGKINEKGVVIEKLVLDTFLIKYDGLVKVVVGTEALRRELLVLAITKNL